MRPPAPGRPGAGGGVGRVARERQHRGRWGDGAAGVVAHGDGRGIDDGVGRERDAAGVVHGPGDCVEGAGFVEDRDRARDCELCPRLYHGDVPGSAQAHHDRASCERGGDRQRALIGARDIRNLRLRGQRGWADRRGGAAVPAKVQPRLRGRSVLVRYADDVVIVLEQESDAHRVWDVLPKRLGRFGLTMHPAKSRLVPFRRPRRGWRPGQDGDRFPPPGTFDVLGFTHYWGLARTGSWVLKRKTAKDRLRRTLTATNRWCGVHRHASVAEQHRMLVSKLRGHCAYYGITGNASSLSTCSFHVVHIWQKWLNRRSQKRSMPWKRFLRLLARYPLPRMTAIHSVARA